MKEKVDIRVLHGWGELSQEQLEYVFGCMTNCDRGLDRDELRLCMALQLSGLQVLDGKSNLFKTGDMEIVLSRDEVTQLFMEYEWLQAWPEKPVRLDVIDGARAISARMEELTFEDYITADNFYQGMLYNEDESYLDSITMILYPGIKIRDKSRRMSRLNTLYWWTSFKMWAARRWPHFLQPANRSEDENKFKTGIYDARASSAAQIRALTKGDVTKEEDVRHIPCHRALTELDALAKEAEELERLKKN